jgi:hypothetical protein
MVFGLQMRSLVGTLRGGGRALLVRPQIESRRKSLRARSIFLAKPLFFACPGDVAEMAAFLYTFASPSLFTPVLGEKGAG